MSEERLQEIKDSVKFQYTLAKAKGIDNALLFTNEEEELIEEIEKLKEELEYTIPIVEHNKTITKHLKEIERLNNIINELEKEISKHIALCTDITLNDILDKLQELKGSDKE